MFSFPTQPMEIPEQEVDDGDRNRFAVTEWRAEQLKRLGLGHALAEVFADVVDWHALAALVARGCAPELALEIVR